MLSVCPHCNSKKFVVLIIMLEIYFCFPHHYIWNIYIIIIMQELTITNPFNCWKTFKSSLVSRSLGNKPCIMKEPLKLLDSFSKQWYSVNQGHSLQFIMSGLSILVVPCVLTVPIVCRPEVLKENRKEKEKKKKKKRKRKEKEKKKKRK